MAFPIRRHRDDTPFKIPSFVRCWAELFRKNIIMMGSLGLGYPLKKWINNFKPLVKNLPMLHVLGVKFLATC